MRAALYSAAAMVAFTVPASLVFLAGTNLIGTYQIPLWQWWVYLWFYGTDPDAQGWLLFSGIVGAILPLGFGGSVLLRKFRVQPWSLRRAAATPLGPVIRGNTDNNGHARWMTWAEAHDLWTDEDRGFGAIIVGEEYAPDKRIDGTRFRPGKPRTWGRGGKKPLIRDTCETGSTHSLIIAGSGSYKTVSAVSTLLHWTGSAVVLDPSTELGPMLRRDKMRIGHQVYELHPNTAHEVGFNALDWIDIASPMAESDVRAVVEWVCGDTPRATGGDGSHQHFKEGGKQIVTCLLAHMLWDDALPQEQKTLRTLRAALNASEKELREIFKAIRQGSNSRMARMIAGDFVDLTDVTYSGKVDNAKQDTGWLANSSYASLVSGSAFRTADICNGETTVFIGIPLKVLDATPAIARVIVGALLNAAYEADGAVTGRILYLLDEASSLGKMGILATARKAGRKYGITLQPYFQSVGQIIEIWGREGKRAWYEDVAWRSYAAIDDAETAREISDTLGHYGVLAWSEGENSGRSGKGGEASSRSQGRNRNMHEIKRALMTPDEIMNDLRSDAQIILPKDGRPLLCGRAIYFRRPELAARVDANRFAKGKPNV